MKRSAAALAFSALLLTLITATAPAAATAEGSDDSSLLAASTYRYGGDTRYDVAIAVSREWSATDTVFLAKGTDYPDALSAAAVAASLGAPLLLTPSDRLLPSVAARIQELAATRVIIVGGIASVQMSVADELSALGVAVERIAGADRYEVSRNLVDLAFPEGAPAVYVATGGTFPDALSASPAAANAGSPVLLVNGGAGGVDPATADLLGRLGPSQIVIVGGPNSVSAAVQAGLQNFAPVVRISGADRYEASSNVNAYAFGSASRVFFATGQSFADALAGGALAGRQGQPLLVVPGTCVTESAAALVNERFGSAQRAILGGPNSVSDNVFSLGICPPPPPPPTIPDPPTNPNPPTQPGNPGDIKNCDDFGSYAEAKAWYDTYAPYYGDISKLDRDKDGIPCEDLPGAPK